MKKMICIAFALMMLIGCSSSESGSSKGSDSSTIVKNGDIVKIDFVGKLDGVAFQGGTASNAILEIGSGQFIEGFEEKVIGIEKGKSKTIDVTFPKEYQSAELAGKAVTFDVKVNSIYREI